ncbi:MAG: hypothetical protein WC451_00460 [Patescibacteria group bacterium]
MPNIRLAGADEAKTKEVVKMLHHLPDVVIDRVVVTRYLHHPCINRPMAQIACSDEVPQRHLKLIRQAVMVAGVEMPHKWRYTPPMPLYPATVAFCYGLREELWSLCLTEISALHFEPVHVPSVVYDMNLKFSPYAEVRGFWSPEVANDICVASAAAKLKNYMDVEMFSVRDGEIKLSFWLKGATSSP